MAFTNFAHLTQASSGATRNSGTNGDLNALFDWALTGNSNWVRLYHDGTNFYDVWQPAAEALVSLYIIIPPNQEALNLQ